MRLQRSLDTKRNGVREHQPGAHSRRDAVDGCLLPQTIPHGRASCNDAIALPAQGHEKQQQSKIKQTNRADGKRTKFDDGGKNKQTNKKTEQVEQRKEAAEYKYDAIPIFTYLPKDISVGREKQKMVQRQSET